MRWHTSVEEATEAEIESKKEIEKKENSTIVSLILIYDAAENKQVKSPCLPYLPSPVSLPE